MTKMIKWNLSTMSMVAKLYRCFVVENTQKWPMGTYQNNRKSKDTHVGAPV